MDDREVSLIVNLFQRNYFIKKPLSFSKLVNVIYIVHDKLDVVNLQSPLPTKTLFDEQNRLVFDIRVH